MDKDTLLSVFFIIGILAGTIGLLIGTIRCATADKDSHKQAQCSTLCSAAGGQLESTDEYAWRHQYCFCQLPDRKVIINRGNGVVIRITREH